MLIKKFSMWKVVFQLSNAVSDDFIWYLIVIIFKFEYDRYLTTFKPKMGIFESTFFADFGNFGQLLLTTCWPMVKFDIGTLERVIWSLFPPNIMVRNSILALGPKKNRFFSLFSAQAGCWNNYLHMSFDVQTAICISNNYFVTGVDPCNPKF